MGNLFVAEGLVRPYVVAIDTALLKSKGHVCMACGIHEKRINPYSGIDPDAKWGYSRTKGWILNSNCI